MTSLQFKSGGLQVVLSVVMAVTLHAQVSTPVTPPTQASVPDQGAVSRRPSTTSRAEPDLDPYVLRRGEDPENRLVSPFVKHLAIDQKEFWTAPSRLRINDLRWIAPLAGVTAAFIASDSWWAKQVDPSHAQTSLHVSDYGAYSLIGLGGASFLFGHVTHNDHLQEAGLLSGEAAINSAAVAYLLKTTTQRQRPLDGNEHGNFFQGGASFPSEHSAMAWSIASVWAHEYPGWLSQTAAYGLASAITVTRVTASQHFPSDVIVGSALGWYFGRQVYRAHHDPELGGSGWGSLLEEKTRERPRSAENMGSPYVPVDSWVYPALDRLIALGYVHSDIVGLRPWTRLQCARLVEDASGRLQSDSNGEASAQKLFDALSTYFQREIGPIDGASNVGASVDSIYTRAMGISGQPLRDGFHLGQTIVNDYGRPYSEGFNNVSGFSAHAEAGPFYIGFQGEYQSAPAMASYPANALRVLASLDQTPVIPNGVPAVSRFRLLDSSVGFTYHNFQVSFGKESLWLGPGLGGPFLFSNNAEPIPMVRFDQISPVYIPGLSRILGPMRSEFALGRMDGAQWINSVGTLYGPDISNQPFVHVDKVGFKPTENFEFSMGFTSVFGGPGSPVTWGNFFRTYNPRCAIGNCTVTLFDLNYGDRRSTADFSYRIPHLRDWATLYADSFVEDEISPIGSSRPAIRAGLYLPKLPRISQLDLRAEAVYTDAPNTVFIGNYYDNGRYRSGYTNYGQIMGSWIGRAGKGGQAWATYWFNPRTTLQFQYRRQVVSKEFLPGGGGLNDFAVKGEFQARSDLSVQAFLQSETWNFPVLSPTPKSNITASVQLTFFPKWTFNKK